jgi:hypothetical protein
MRVLPILPILPSGTVTFLSVRTEADEAVAYVIEAAGRAGRAAS